MTANEPHFEVFPEKVGEAEAIITGAQGLTGEFRWHFKDADGHITFTGAESFTRQEDAYQSIFRMVHDTVGAAFGDRILILFHAVDLAALIVTLDENGAVIG